MVSSLDENNNIKVGTQKYRNTPKHRNRLVFTRTHLYIFLFSNDQYFILGLNCCSAFQCFRLVCSGLYTKFIPIHILDLDEHVAGPFSIVATERELGITLAPM